MRRANGARFGAIVKLVIMDKRVYVIDGTKFSSLEEFARYFSDVVLEDYQWGGGLDAFNDILRGGFGTPLGGYVIRWEDSDLSRRNLGVTETARWLDEIISKCHPTSVPHFEHRLKQVQVGKGETLFDEIVEIIREHGIGGNESMDEVELQLL